MERNKLGARRRCVLPRLSRRHHRYGVNERDGSKRPLRRFPCHHSGADGLSGHRDGLRPDDGFGGIQCVLGPADEPDHLCRGRTVHGGDSAGCGGLPPSDGSDDPVAELPAHVLRPVYAGKVPGDGAAEALYDLFPH